MKRVPKIEVAMNGEAELLKAMSKEAYAEFANEYNKLEGRMNDDIAKSGLTYESNTKEYSAMMGARRKQLNDEMHEFMKKFYYLDYATLDYVVM